MTIFSKRNPVPDSALVSARIVDLRIEQQDIKSILITVNVIVGDNSPDIAYVSGTLKEMCILFNSIPYKGKFLTGPLKNKLCRIYSKEGKYIFHSLTAM